MIEQNVPFELMDLKPCAHCGGKAEWHSGSSTKCYIKCSHCGIRTHGYKSRPTQQLFEIWNRRIKEN